IGQSDSEITELADLSVYVMTPEYGAPSQLEKIDMLELADFVVLNKSDRHGAEDALRDVRKQWRRNHGGAAAADAEIPVFATVASRFQDPGVERFYRALAQRLEPRLGPAPAGARAPVEDPAAAPLVPGARRRCLAEIAETVRAYRARSDAAAERADDAWALARALRALGDEPPEGLARYPEAALADGAAPPE